METKLAIVIPAYKIDFFDACLGSIARQTCKDFNLYIGDDASRSDLKWVVDKYKAELNIFYKRFPENMGGTDLIGHWNRCIGLVQKEEWVWLFSDDDEMGDDCVENFYQYKEKFPGFDLFHFNLIRINEKGESMGDKVQFNDIITKEELLLGRLRSTVQTTVVEYIFRKDRFLEEGSFQKFDLAWGSDDATWMKMARFTDIKNIPDSTVYWRYSTVNISTQNQNQMVLRKLYARIEFSNWVLHVYPSSSLLIKPTTLKYELRQWFERFLTFGSQVLTRREVSDLLHAFYKTVPGNRFLFYRRLLGIRISVWTDQIKRKIKNQLNFNI